MCLGYGTFSRTAKSFALLILLIRRHTAKIFQYSALCFPAQGLARNNLKKINFLPLIHLGNSSDLYSRIQCQIKLHPVEVTFYAVCSRRLNQVIKVNYESEATK
jgi:hypothetical protein